MFKSVYIFVKYFLTLKKNIKILNKDVVNIEEPNLYIDKIFLNYYLANIKNVIFK